jgi:arsenite methyltransferase
MAVTVDVQELEEKVKDMYSHVALEPHGKYHFEMGRGLAEKLGYPVEWLDRIPAAAIESFAGVGHFFDLADLREGEAVVDLGSGSGTDMFCAALQVGADGRVVGVDFTDEQLEKARRLAGEGGFRNVELCKAPIESVPLDGEGFDCVISNGVINLAPDKGRVFSEAARLLKPGGRMAIADIISERELKESTRCNADLWAACIAGAEQRDSYLESLEGAGLTLESMRENPYEFISEQAIEASDKYGVKSVSLLAKKA